MLRRRLGMVMALASAGALMVPPPTDAVVRLRHATLTGTTLRISGSDATPGATVFVGSSASFVSGVANAHGNWLIIAKDFVAPDCTVVVDDGTGGVLTNLGGCILPPNVPPVADAGADQVVNDVPVLGSEPVTLSGFGSYDPDGGALSYLWTLISPHVENYGTSPAQVVELAPGGYTFRLDVTDNRGATATDTVQITVVAAPPGTYAATVDVTVSPMPVTVLSTFTVSAVITNIGNTTMADQLATIETFGSGISSLSPGDITIALLAPGESTTVAWTARADVAGPINLVVRMMVDGNEVGIGGAFFRAV